MPPKDPHKYSSQGTWKTATTVFLHSGLTKLESFSCFAAAAGRLSVLMAF